MVLGPTDSEPRGVADAVALTGGWLVLGSPIDWQNPVTKLEVVRVADLK
jgi:hypothetical protein